MCSQVPVSGTNTASPYVKVYLLPDPYKMTKKKTKVAKKTLHPTYNETVSCDHQQVTLALATSAWCNQLLFTHNHVASSLLIVYLMM